MPNCLDWGLGAELLAQAPDAEVDHVRARIEVVAPDLGEQTLAAQHFAGMENELVQEPELTVGEVGDQRPASLFPDVSRCATHFGRLPLSE